MIIQSVPPSAVLHKMTYHEQTVCGPTTMCNNGYPDIKQISRAIPDTFGIVNISIRPITSQIDTLRILLQYCASLSNVELLSSIRRPSRISNSAQACNYVSTAL